MSDEKRLNIDTTSLEEDARRAENILEKLGETIVTQHEQIEKLTMNMGKLMSEAFSIKDAGSFMTEIIRLGKEFQTTETALGIFLESAEEVSDFMKEMESYTFLFGFDQVSEQATHLLELGHTGEEVIAILDKLAIVATGTGKSLGDWTNLYSNLETKGTLDTDDLEAWAGKGVDLLEEFSEALGVTKDHIFSMVEAGRIGFSDVSGILDNLTAAGGEYEKATRENLVAITGNVEQMEQSWNNMLTIVGKEGNNIFNAGIGVIESLLHNYENLGKVLTTLKSTYSVYRAAVMAVTVVQRIQTEMQVQAALTSRTLTTAQSLQAVAATNLNRILGILNKTMLSNPWVAAATAIAAVTAAMWAFRDSATAAEKAQKAFNDEQERFQSIQRENRQNIESLIRIIQDKTETDYAHKKAYEELCSLSPELAKQYDLEALKTARLTDLQKELNEARDEADYQNLLDNIENIKNKISSFQSEIESYKATSNSDPYGLNIIDLRKRIEELKELQGNYEKEIKDHQDRLKSLRPVEVRLAEAQADLEQIEKEYEKIRNQLEEEKRKQAETGFFYEISFSLQINEEQLRKQLEEQKGKVGNLNQEKENKNKTEEDSEKEKAAKKAEEQAKKDKELNKQVVDNHQKLTQTTIEMMENGEEKELKQLEENHRRTLAQIKKEQEELLAAYKNAGKRPDQEVMDQFDERRALEVKKFQQEEIAIKEKYTDRMKDIQIALNEYLISEEERKLETLNRKFDEYRQRVMASDLAPEAKEEQLAKIDQAQTQAGLGELLQKYQSFADKRKAIEEQYERDIERLREKNTDGRFDQEIEAATKAKYNALAALDNSIFNDDAFLTTLFGDMSDVATKEIDEIIEKARELYDLLQNGEWSLEVENKFDLSEAQFNSLKNNPEQMKKIGKQIGDVTKSANESKGALDKMAGGIKKIFSAGDNDKQFAEGMKDLAAGMTSAMAAGNALSGCLKGIADAANSDALGGAADGLKDAMEVAGATLQGAQAGAALGPMGAAVGAGIGAVTSLVGKIGENKEFRRQLRKQIEDNQRNDYLAELEINQLWRERYEWAQKIGESTLTHIARQGKELTDQTSANARHQQELMAKLMGTDYKANEYFKKTGLFGWGKGKIVEEWSTLAGKSWEQIELLAAQGKLSEEGKLYYEALKKAREEGEDLAKRQEEYLEMVRETFAGSSYDSIVDGIVDGFKEGKRSADDFAETFEELMQNAIASSLRLLTDEKMRKWYENFAGMAEKGLTDTDIERARKDYLELVEQLGREAEALERVTGIALGNSEEVARSKGIATASQDSVDELNGRFTAIQSHTYHINENVQMLALNSAGILRHLAGIETNTEHCSRLEDIQHDMSAVKYELKDIALKGIHIRR